MGEPHEVTARLFDSLGAIAGAALELSVASGPPAQPASATLTTDGAGLARYSFTNATGQAGTSTITARHASGATATAQVEWTGEGPGPQPPPDCTRVQIHPSTLWPPNHRLVEVALTAPGAAQPLALVVTGITQDEPTDGTGDGDTCPDAALNPSLRDRARLRAERSGRGNGRVYRVHFTGTSQDGQRCEGQAVVGVPHDRQRPAVDSSPSRYDSTTGCSPRPDKPRHRCGRPDPQEPHR